MSLAQLRLLQLVSPALPVGAFSYSEGLEALVQAGRLRDAAGMGRWLEGELRRGALAIEAAALPQLMAALETWRLGLGAQEPGDGAGCLDQQTARQAVVELDGWLLAQREAPELRAQQRQMGQSLLQLLAQLGWPLPAAAPQLAWPAAWAWAGLCLELDPSDVVAGYLYGWVANQLSAAVRLVPLGPTEAQRLQLALGPLIETRATELLQADPRGLFTGGVGASLAQLGHGELYSRLFRS
jgi:urease accessory protein